MLVEAPDALFAEAVVDLQASITAVRERETSLDIATALRPARKAAFDELRTAFRGNAAFLAQVQAPLLAKCTKAGLLARVAHAKREGNTYNHPLAWVARDWSGERESEQEIAVAMRAVRQNLELVSEQPGTALVLGAGVGRFAHELSTLFPRVIAIELALPMVVSHQLVMEDACRFYGVADSNCVKAEDRVQAIDGAKGRSQVSSRTVEYVVASAGDLPLVAGSAAVVFSIYFTDVIPLSELLHTVRRVLTPGGSFIHFGPLGYHAENDLGEALAADEVRDAFEEAGFSFVAENWVPNSLLRTKSMKSQVFNNWSFLAKVGRRGPSTRITAKSILRIDRPHTVEAILTATVAGVEHLGGKASFGSTSLELGPSLLEILNLINGKRTLAEVLRALQRTVGRLSRRDAQEVRAKLQELVRIGLVAVSAPTRTANHARKKTAAAAGK